jgi:hypothetical protein
LRRLIAQLTTSQLKTMSGRDQAEPNSLSARHKRRTAKIDQLQITPVCHPAQRRAAQIDQLAKFIKTPTKAFVVWGGYYCHRHTIR